MALSVSRRSHALAGIFTLCLVSSTALSSSVYAEIAPFKPITIASSAEAADASHDKSEPDLLSHNEQLPPEAQPLPWRESSLTDTKTTPALEKKKPVHAMKITIPNLRTLDKNPNEPIVTASAELPATTYRDPRPSRTVAEFKPVNPLPDDGFVISDAAPQAETFAELAPAAGGDTPLIAAPEAEVQPPVPTAASPAIPPVTPPVVESAVAPTVASNSASAVLVPPPLPPLPQAPNATAPHAVEPSPSIASPQEEKPIIEEGVAEALDRALTDEPSLSGKSSLPPALPELAKVVPEAEEPKKAKKRTPRREKPRTLAPVYSPLDSEPAPLLSDESEAIAQRIPSNLDNPKRLKTQRVEIDRVKDLDALSLAQGQNEGDDSTSGESHEHEALGIKIRVSNHAPNLDHELGKAYDALMSGQPTLAIDIYKNVLSNDPKNKGALFGLATTYHRSGQLDQARDYYGRLLAIAPRHRDGLNNFLVLIADEAPQQALEKMQELAQRNPNFSPIPAQMAVIHQRLGQPDQALEQMFRAVALEPENLAYRYNLAVMLDKQKKYDEAARLYKQLVEAASRGMVIPGNLQKIQQRLTFISSNR